MRPNAKRVASRWAQTQKVASRNKTAGEVRFVKDRSGDAGSWGWGAPGPSERQILPDFVFQARYLKPLAKSMRSSLMALGHVISSYNTFARIKSRNISPDGNLGGRGYIQKIPEMRRQLMNCVEALSAYTDTVYDEMSAPHWSPDEDTLDPRDREEVREIVEEAEEIREDPESWAEENEEEVQGKTASAASLPAHLQVLEDTISDLSSSRTAEDFIRHSANILTASQYVRRGARVATKLGSPDE